MKSALGATLICLIAAALSSCGRSNDSKFEKQLYGTWQSEPMESKEAKLEGETRYVPGGRMTISGRIVFRHALLPDEQRAITGSGQWHVKDGYLHYTLETSNISDILPNGFSSADKIIGITDTEFTYVDSSSGRTKVDRRLRHE